LSLVSVKIIDGGLRSVRTEVVRVGFITFFDRPLPEAEASVGARGD